MAMLTEPWLRIAIDGGWPSRASTAPRCISAQRARHGVGNTFTLALRQPSPTVQEWDHVSCVPVHRPQIFRLRTTQILNPDRAICTFLQVAKKTGRLRFIDSTPTRLAGD